MPRHQFYLGSVEILFRQTLEIGTEYVRMAQSYHRHRYTYHCYLPNDEN